MFETEFTHYLKRLAHLRISATENVLVASIGEKKLGLYKGSQQQFVCAMSSAHRPRSCIEDSLGTPWGLHAVAQKHGADASPGTVFQARKCTGERWFDRSDAGPSQKSLVTTRILRLRGLEPGLNKGPGIDSFERFIYIHGTNHPDRFPQNISAGCLLLQDDDLIKIFAATPEGSHVWISEPSPFH